MTGEQEHDLRNLLSRKAAGGYDSNNFVNLNGVDLGYSPLDIVINKLKEILKN